jgi:hypothetical protein
MEMRVAAAVHAARHHRGLGVLGGGKLPFELVRQPDIVGIEEGEPLLRATAGPALGWRSRRTSGKSRATSSAVSSGDPSSTTITSSTRTVWSRMLRSAAAMVAAAL